MTRFSKSHDTLLHQLFNLTSKLPFIHLDTSKTLNIWSIASMYDCIFSLSIKYSEQMMLTLLFNKERCKIHDKFKILSHLQRLLSPALKNPYFLPG